MATQLVSHAASKDRQYTLRDLMIWIGVFGVLWGIPSFLPVFTVGAILASVVYAGFILRRITRWKWCTKVINTSVLLFCGFHLLLTGFPFPIYLIDRLQSPIAVVHLHKDALQLADGRQVSLPMIKEIPADDAVFNMALQHGVEVCDNGEVYGLAEWPKFCGNDPSMYNLRRINLTELAAALHPTGIDDAVIPAAEISHLAANPSFWAKRGQLPVDTFYRVRLVLGRAEE